MGIKYGYSAFNYYGLPVYSPESSVTLVPENFDRETNQVNQTIQAKIGVESKEDAPVGYLLDLGYTNFSHKYALSKEQDGPTEHTFDVMFLPLSYRMPRTVPSRLIRISIICIRR